MTYSVSTVSAKAAQEALLEYISHLNTVFRFQNVMCAPFHLGVPVFPCLYICAVSIYGCIMYIDFLQLSVTVL
jgi:hypothetical protein